MEENALKLIYKVCPKDYLMEALFYKDYVTGIEVLTEQLDSINEITGMFTVFDALDKALQSGSVIEVINAIKMCEKEYPICLSIDIINLLSSFDNEFNTEDDICENEKELEIAINYLTNYYNVSQQELFNFANALLERYDKKYPKVRALEKVYSMPFYGDNILEDLSKITEDLIYGGEVTMYDVWESIIDCSPDKLMEQMAVMKFLREKYYIFREPEVMELQKKISGILDFGLKRNK